MGGQTIMNLVARSLASVSLIAVCLITVSTVRAGDNDDRLNRYVSTNLTSNQLRAAPNTDAVLQNAWGVAFTPGASPFWIADNATGCSTLYDGQGAIASTLQVKIPLPNGDTSTACQPVEYRSALVLRDEKGRGGVPHDAGRRGRCCPWRMLGPATATSNGLYVPVTTDGGFKDPDIPSGFAPFGIQNINGNLFVTYAKQNGVKHDDVAGPGNGFVDIFDTDGHLLRRFASRGALNSPWGVARASYAFGRFSGDVLIGNFGNGQVNAFDSDGDFLGTLSDVKGKPLVIDGLWTLTLGGGKNSNEDTLYFTAGPNGETDGLFGTITPVSKQ
jgi:hypothetical protein